MEEEIEEEGEGKRREEGALGQVSEVSKKWKNGSNFFLLSHYGSSPSHFFRMRRTHARLRNCQCSSISVRQLGGSFLLVTTLLSIFGHLLVSERRAAREAPSSESPASVPGFAAAAAAGSRPYSGPSDGSPPYSGPGDVLVPASDDPGVDPARQWAASAARAAFLASASGAQTASFGNVCAAWLAPALASRREEGLRRFAVDRGLLYLYHMHKGTI